MRFCSLALVVASICDARVWAPAASPPGGALAPPGFVDPRVTELERTTEGARIVVLNAAFQAPGAPYFFSLDAFPPPDLYVRNRNEAQPPFRASELAAGGLFGLVGAPPPSFTGARMPGHRALPPVAAREHFPLLLLYLGQSASSIGVEVGVSVGEYAAFFLERWPGTLHLVDPYEAQDGYELLDLAGRSNFSAALETARKNTARFGRRAVFHREYSVAAAAKFADASLDYVYLDARHDQASLAADMQVWYPKLREGGFFAGHDFLWGTVGSAGVFSVTPAVLEFATVVQRQPLVTFFEFMIGASRSPSWYWLK